MALLLCVKQYDFLTCSQVTLAGHYEYRLSAECSLLFIVIVAGSRCSVAEVVMSEY